MAGQFRASNMSRAARQAAKFNGLATVGSYDILSHVTIYDPEHQADLMDTIVIRAYSPSGRKSVDITADHIYTMEALYQDAPMARIA